MNLDAQNLLIYSEELRECISQRRCSKLLKEFVSYGDYIQGTEPELQYVDDINYPNNISEDYKEMLISYKNAKQRQFFNSSPWVYKSFVDHNNMNEKITNFVAITIKLKNKLKESRDGSQSIQEIVQELFQLSEYHLKCFNRLSETQTIWITEPLFCVAKQFFRLSSGFDMAFSQAGIDIDSEPSNENGNTYTIGDLEKETYLEKASRTIQTSYKICLNDREVDSWISKLSNVYCFINLNFAIYEKLQKFDLEKAYVKVLKDRLLKNQLPDVSNSNFSNFDKMWFNYYMGKHFIALNDWSTAVKYLIESFQYCNIYCKTMIHKILNYLIPAYIHQTSKLPKIFDEDLIPEAWKNLIYFLKKGDLQGFNLWIKENELFLLQHNLIPLALKLKDLCTARLLQKFWMMNNQSTILDTKDFSILWKQSKDYGDSLNNKNLSEKQTNLNNANFENEIFDFLKNSLSANRIPIIDDEQELINEVECVFTNLIRNRYLNGYISHGNRKLVVSKTVPFPVFQAKKD